MYTEHDFEIISDIIRSNIPGTKEIILFGSYARGVAREESDADIAVIVDKEIERQKKLRALGKTWTALGEKGYMVDIIIKTKSKFDIDKEIPVTLSHTIYHEGKPLWIARNTVKLSANG